jgi:DNA-binding transcriptional MerR regulator|tara:strand:- start:1 stop:456 length:456 start_codon:yes stop_codon:yes gene_type:complete
MGVQTYSNDFKVEVCNFSNDNTYTDTAKKFGISARTVRYFREYLGYPNVGRGQRQIINEEIQIAACQMYMGNPSITQQEVSDHFGISTQSLCNYLRKHGFSLKVAKRKALPTTSESSAQRMAHNFKVLKTEHSLVKAELMKIRSIIEESKV